MTEPAGRPPRRTWVEMIMGLPISVLVRGPGVDGPAVSTAVDSVHAELRRLDAMFSTYRPDSEISRIRRGELAIEDASPLVRQALDLCRLAARDTDGWFAAWRPGPEGRRQLDPSGLVKGWAVERASASLRALDGHDWLINAGGDILGSATSGPPWRVAVEDPRERSRVLAVVPLITGAVATSSAAARGDHLINPRTGRPAASDLLSATVNGPSLTIADVYATTVFVEGRAALRRVAALPGYEAFVVLPDGRMIGTPGHGDRPQPNRPTAAPAFS
ncbi:MAG: FAD:protein FMN transferase [bacterium]